VPIIVWKLWHKTQVSTYLFVKVKLANTI
jgi:hypothetical protein